MCTQEAYDAYKQHFEASPAAVLRDCIDIAPGGEPISIDEVEPAANIMERFCTGGMSLGAISRETHETIAVAMNRIGGKRQTIVGTCNSIVEITFKAFMKPVGF